MTQIYKHTQIGYFLFALLGGGVLITLGFILTAGSNLALITVCVVLTVCAIVFRSMTVEISDGVLRWGFGSGIIHKSVQVMDIESTKIVHNSWLYGLGIHPTPHGWLYNVAGFSAVEVRLKSGKQFRLGTDKPEEFAQAIQNAKAIRPTQTQ
jgi:hypothetical protein